MRVLRKGLRGELDGGQDAEEYQLDVEHERIQEGLTCFKGVHFNEEESCAEFRSSDGGAEEKINGHDPDSECTNEREECIE